MVDGIVRLTDEEVIQIIRDLLPEDTKELDSLGLVLGKVVVPTISLNSSIVGYEHTELLIVAGGYYELPEGVVVATAVLSADEKLEVRQDDGYKIRLVPGVGLNGHVGPFVSGSNYKIRFYNTHSGSANLHLLGWRFKRE